MSSIAWDSSGNPRRVIAVRRAQVAQDGVDQGGVDLQPGRVRGAGDRQPEIGFGHWPDDELAVLQRTASSGQAAHRSQKSPRTAITTSAGGRAGPAGPVAAAQAR